MFYNFRMLNRHFLLHFDALGGMGVLAATLFCLSGYVSTGTAGVCITSAMLFFTSVHWVCNHWTGLELDLKSVERLVEYLDLPQEPLFDRRIQQTTSELAFKLKRGWYACRGRPFHQLRPRTPSHAPQRIVQPQSEEANWTPRTYGKWKVYAGHESTAIRRSLKRANHHRWHRHLQDRYV